MSIPTLNSKCIFVGRALRVLLGLQPLTTTVYPLRVLPAGPSCRAQPDLRIVVPLKWKWNNTMQLLLHREHRKLLSHAERGNDKPGNKIKEKP